ncbi:3-methyl-2-oxobutanoate hydroxymethyltransferase [Legionella israelensis]|uniref:3-methyl-2-oxobutanoate hydroxymethyltransferase n=1 Tax=Legionella israelensis TaxID=454 RepID=A0A0W0W2H1_9GAMM|nr:3-methyl-2-oxobutanoate hydroxymethyltransferase [Legionella israelensis]KTD26102.1 3-methyl-2-oxobutanoate hydroxymethyltransferase [Legionella israelensis]QBS10111.1 3-methyl-2-oxobutanoate hydroxymethyltransferase [Legionella israelensis]SCY07988.1 3-methyl-2-oxobutanoate hydroxymethyltransferase [Legionella israelensis DSM 19235]STX59698.1 3-methyl-2-oxobutanoate hydroxymethyltransferase [Legionella israelensis]
MNILDFKKKKQQQQKISMLTCYDYPSACIIAETELDCVLVGDSVAMVVHGHNSTLMATMDMMVLHTEAVARGLKQQFLVSDMPFLSHKESQSETVRHVKRLLQAGAHAVKIEGAEQDTCERIQFLVSSGIPVMGHIGLTPQSVHQLGGYVVQGKTTKEGEKLLHQAQQLEAAGCFALVIECVPQLLAKLITESLSIPTIGIGASHYTDGQVLVWHDMLGLQTAFKPKFLKQFTQGKEWIHQAIRQYDTQVKQVHFPATEHAY